MYSDPTKMKPRGLTPSFNPNNFMGLGGTNSYQNMTGMQQGGMFSGNQDMFNDMKAIGQSMGLSDPQSSTGFPGMGGMLMPIINKELHRKAVLGDGVTSNDVMKNAVKTTGDRFSKVNSLNMPYSPTGYDMSSGIGNATPNPVMPKSAASSDGSTAENPVDMINRVNMGEAPKPSPLGMLPVVGSVFDLGDALVNGPDQIKYDRLAFEGVDYNPIIQANNAQIRRRVNTGRENVRTNARTFGQSNQGMSAMNLRGAQMEGENTAKLGAMQRNTNAEIFNKERMANQQIDTMEQEAQRQANTAHQQRILSNVTNIGMGFAGFGADKAKMAADHAFNGSFMEAMGFMSPIMRANMTEDQILKLQTIFEEQKS